MKGYEMKEALKRIAAYPFSRAEELSVEQMREIAREALAQPDPYMQGYADAMNWKVQNHLEHLTAAQPEQEPVAWAEFDGEGGYHFRAYENNEDYAEQWDKRNPNHVGWVKPLYTTPPQRTWVGLDNDDLVWIYSNSDKVGQAISNTEAKLKEKNT